MKNAITLLILFVVTHIAFAQPPQGLNYQAVALGAGGQPLSNHNISLRLSVLDSSATGTAVYVETQSVTTDTFGLFSLVIGGGTAVTGTFGGISWGHNNKWLKTEMDTTGGSNFTLIGVTQFMSVPYAMYAGKTTNSTVSYEFPDGLDSIIPVFLNHPINYTVPVGMNFYITSMTYDTNMTCGAEPGSIFWLNGTDTSNLMVETVSPSSWSHKVGAVGEGNLIQSCSVSLGGFLVRKTVIWIEQNIKTASYTVPAGKILILKQLSCWAGSTFTIDGVRHRSLAGDLILDQGQVIASMSSQGFMSIIGYLRNR